MNHPKTDRTPGCTIGPLAGTSAVKESARTALNAAHWRAPAVEAAMIVVFLVIALGFGTTPATMIVAWCYAWFLITVLVIDLETRRVLNAMLLPAALFAVAAGLWLQTPSMPSMLAGGLVGIGLFGLLYVIGRMLFGRAALGLGDVKLAGVIGLMTGYPDVMRALVIGVLLGGAAALVLLATRRAGMKSTSAYAPYLALGAMIALWTTLGS